MNVSEAKILNSKANPFKSYKSNKELPPKIKITGDLDPDLQY